jgi:hypothetical protein
MLVVLLVGTATVAYGWMTYALLTRFPLRHVRFGVAGGLAFMWASLALGMLRPTGRGWEIAIVGGVCAVMWVAWQRAGSTIDRVRETRRTHGLEAPYDSVGVVECLGLPDAPNRPIAVEVVWQLEPDRVWLAPIRHAQIAPLHVPFEAVRSATPVRRAASVAGDPPEVVLVLWWHPPGAGQPRRVELRDDGAIVEELRRRVQLVA